MLEIAICEDEQADRECLQGMLYTILDKYNIERQITCYSSGEELLDSGIQFQLIFMDIVMEGRNGIDIGQEIYNRNHTAKIIYQTNFGDYCREALNTVHAFAYMEKPVDARILEQQVVEFLKQYRKEEVQLEFRSVSFEENGIAADKPSVLLSVSTIQYFEYVKTKKKVKIVTESTVYEYTDVISSLEARMRPYGFETSCRGILVNLRNVMKIKGYEVILRNGASVPLSQKRVTEFKKRLNECIHSGE